MKNNRKLLTIVNPIEPPRMSQAQLDKCGPSGWGLQLAELKAAGDVAAIARELAEIRRHVPELEKAILGHAKRHFEALKKG